MKYLKYLIVLIFFSGCAYLGYLKDPFVAITNFRQVNENIYSGGTPKPAGLKTLKDLKIKTIINLRNDTPEYELSFAKNNNIEIINIPMSIYQRPKKEQVLDFLNTTLDKTKHPIFVHCQSGRDRTGTMIAIYRITVDGLTIRQAYQEAKDYGFWPYRGDDALKNFLHQLKDYPEFYKLKNKTISGQD